MKNIKNNLISLSQDEISHIQGGSSHKDKISSVLPIFDAIAASSLAFIITKSALSENSDSMAPVIVPILVGLISGCDKNSITCDNSIHKAVIGLSSTIAVAAKYFLPKYRHF